MYSDPTKIRSHIVKIRLSDEEDRLVQAFVEWSGEQKAALLRELILQQVRETLEAPVEALMIC